MAGDSPKTVTVAADLHKQAMLEEDQGNCDQALELYQKSLEINQSLGNKAGLAYTLGQIGNVHCKLQHYTQAQTAYEECLKLSREIEDNSSVAKALHQLAILEEEQDNYSKALELYRKSLDIEKELGNKAGIAESLSQMGRVAEIQDNLAEAASFYAVALVIFQKLKSPYVILVSKWLSQIQAKLAEAELESAVEARMQEYREFL